MQTPQEREHVDYQVVICGGGLAGLTLARQLRLAISDLPILVLEKQQRPLPIATHKVGESSEEGGAAYFKTLGLHDHLLKTQLKKFGLRFFGGSRHDRFEKRCELGPVDFPPIDSYQFDRGTLENDLRQMNDDMGIAMEEGISVDDIELGVDRAAHRVTYSRKGEAPRTVTCRWVVDAMGRRRYLQTKLGLRKESPHRASASWWRIDGERDIATLVAPSNEAWHKSVDQSRWLSTNHVAGHGYWVWLIPLSCGQTSVGIVAEESLHPIKDRSSYETSLAWLRKHEPQVAELMGDDAPNDFHALKHFAHLSEKALSPDRWSCVGDAAVFTDPLYSQGSNLIGWGNTITARIIELDYKGELTDEIVENYNAVFLQHAANLTALYAKMFETFSTDSVYLSKLLWDTMILWCLADAVPAHNILEDWRVIPELTTVLERATELNQIVQRLLRQWAARTTKKQAKAGYYVWRDFQYLRRIRRAYAEKQSVETFMQSTQTTLLHLEEMAQAFYVVALRDIDPAAAARLPEDLWLNVDALDLDNAGGTEDRLFQPTTAARDIKPLIAAIEDYLNRPGSPHLRHTRGRPTEMPPTA